MIELWRVLRDPRVSTALALAAIVVVGLLLLSQGWRGSAATLFVPYQVPYLVSGGITGLALVMVGLTVVSVAARRRDALLREQQTQLLADALRELRAALDPDDRA